MREWIEVVLRVPAEAADAVSNRIVELGAPGVVEEADAPGRLCLRAYFEARRHAPAIVARLRRFLGSLEEFFPGAGASVVEARPLAQEDWAETWKRGFPPVEVGRFRIRTPWTPPAADGRVEIEILPAMAFGTGQHASTRGCLAALELLAREGVLLDPALDVGTGSGILALAAARLGVRRVLAIDEDPVAVEAARQNVEENRLGSAIEIRRATPAAVAGRFALILANLYANLLDALLPEFARLALPQAHWVAAGFFDSDRQRLVNEALRWGWIERRALSFEGWATLVFRKETSCRGSS
jgi:ribosomal protein L11 methyltransferase